MKFTKYIITLFLLPALLLSACIDAELEEVLDYKNHYQTLSDADNAILGLYGKFTQLATQVVILNELRGDLMDITHNSSTDLQEINRGIPSKNNQYSDITPFYSVIQNCNDILYNFKIMKEDSRMSVDEYRERYSDVTALRSWVYLQLGIHFGEVIYTIDPLISIEDALKAQDQKPIRLDELLDKLIDCMEEVNTNGTLENYVVSPLVQEALDGYKLSDFFINKHLLLGDLYLWRGNDEYDYVQAATHYREVLRRNENAASVSNNHLYYKCSATGMRDANNTPHFEVTYWRYKEYDINSLENHWAKMFGYSSEVLNINASSETELSYEHIWAISYDASFAPTYPFTGLFANTGRGTYQLKPSQYIMNTWAEQEQRNNFIFDGRGENSSYKIVNGEPVIEKYLYHYDTAKPFEQRGRWYLYRAGLLHLRYAEAANRAGYPMLAYALLNNGVRNTFRFPDSTYDGDTDQSGWGPNNYYPEPFYLDGRGNGAYRSPWRNNGGIRGRANLKPKEFVDENGVIPTTLQDSIRIMEKHLIDEAALECAFEGHRWNDLLRIARRMDNEGRSGGTFLHESLSKKYSLSGISMPDYSTSDNWYLPFVTTN